MRTDSLNLQIILGVLVNEFTDSFAICTFDKNDSKRERSSLLTVCLCVKLRILSACFSVYLYGVNRLGRCGEINKQYSLLVQLVKSPRKRVRWCICVKQSERQQKAATFTQNV